MEFRHKPIRDQEAADMIRNAVEQLAPITSEDWHAFWERMEPAEVEKGGLLLKAGQVENHLNFLISGIARLFFISHNKEYTLRFNFPGMFFNAYSSFFSRMPSNYAVEAITDIYLYRMTYQQLESLYVESSGAAMVGRRSLEFFYLLKEKREIELLCNTAEQNYRELQRQQPELIQQIPQKYLASYLGITPQSLSRLRRNFPK